MTTEQKDRIVRLAEGAVEKTIQGLNLDDASAQRIIARWDEVVSVMNAKICEIAIDPEIAIAKCKRAREIMGKNFLGIEEVTTHYGIAFGPAFRAELATIPFSEKTLEACKDTHLLVVGCPLTMLEVRAKAPKAFSSHSAAWYNDEGFAADERVGIRWYLIRKDVVPGSRARNVGDQQALIADNEETPCGCELTYAVVLYFLATGERLFQKTYARCADLGSNNRRVAIGGFGPGGLMVVHEDWGQPAGDIGLASCRI